MNIQDARELVREAGNSRERWGQSFKAVDVIGGVDGLLDAVMLLREYKEDGGEILELQNHLKGAKARESRWKKKLDEAVTKQEAASKVADELHYDLESAKEVIRQLRITIKAIEG
ncbi:MAG: hypothetical protein QQN63_05655 [Nitrosopumilus sp.]